LSVVEDLEYVRLLDDGYYWIVEDKVLLSRYEVVETRGTETLVRMLFDFVAIRPDGEPRIARAYYPKHQVPLQTVRRTLYQWEEKWRKLAGEAEALKHYGGS